MHEPGAWQVASTHIFAQLLLYTACCSSSFVTTYGILVMKAVQLACWWLCSWSTSWSKLGPLLVSEGTHGTLAATARITSEYIAVLAVLYDSVGPIHSSRLASAALPLPLRLCKTMKAAAPQTCSSLHSKHFAFKAGPLPTAPRVHKSSRAGRAVTTQVSCDILQHPPVHAAQCIAY